MELVAALQGLHHLTSLQVVQTDGARLLVVVQPIGAALARLLLRGVLFRFGGVLLLLVLEAGD